MKPIAYVSDENYLALAGVSCEFENLDSGSVTVAESSARGAFYLNLPSGRYRVTLSREGFGPKWIEVKLDGSAPFQFRLLSNSLYGFMWPKWVRSGEESEIRTHSPEQFQLSLWRYGLKKEYIRMRAGSTNTAPGPRFRSRPMVIIRKPASSGIAMVICRDIRSSSSLRRNVPASTISGLESRRQEIFVSVDRCARKTAFKSRRSCLLKQLELIQQFRRPIELHQSGGVTPQPPP